MVVNEDGANNKCVLTMGERRSGWIGSVSGKEAGLIWKELRLQFPIIHSLKDTGPAAA
jgi:hypothetical protein